jgi:glyoxylase-like metal-dependent hydrolase (beta-lactamase superfamily II)
MAANTIRILNNGMWSAPGAVVFRHPDTRAEPQPIAMNFFLIESAGDLILVDTGCDNVDEFVAPEYVKAWNLSPARSTRALLENAGVEPGDIETLILSHLHFDHCINLGLFTEARIIVQRREWEHVSSPWLMRHESRSAWPRQIYAYLMDEAWERLELTGDEEELRSGIRTVWTGGHSPGHQVVFVDTSEGQVLLPGDEISRMENLDLHVPPGFFHDFDRVSSALDLIAAFDGIVLPCHDLEVHSRYPDGEIGNLTATGSTKV